MDLPARIARREVLWAHKVNVSKVSPEPIRDGRLIRGPDDLVLSLAQFSLVAIDDVFLAVELWLEKTANCDLSSTVVGEGGLGLCFY